MKCSLGISNFLEEISSLSHFIVHTAKFTVDKQQGHTGEPMELCSMLCGSLDGRAVWGRMDTCRCMTESLSCPPKIVTTLLIGYTTVKKIKNYLQNWESEGIIIKICWLTLETFHLY